MYSSSSVVPNALLTDYQYAGQMLSQLPCSGVITSFDVVFENSSDMKVQDIPRQGKLYFIWKVSLWRKSK